MNNVVWWEYKSSESLSIKLTIMTEAAGIKTHTNPLRKHVYSNKLKFSPPKTDKKKKKKKNFDIFHISAQNIDFGYSLEPPRRGGSNEYPQSMFLIRNKKK